MKTTKNQIENQKSVKFANILASNKMYKEQSLFSVLNFLNKDVTTITMITELNFIIKVTTKQGNEVQKIGLDIDKLKTLCPDYFKVNSKDKDGNLIIIDRLLFAPYSFLKAIYKLYKVC